ncbi:MAG TPA: OmpA family protein, partial [Bacteroidia bacterium]|nr:OmpA family protein [Bacteroidia bacterium]
NKPIRLENIYYDYNKWNIRPDAAVELDKLVKIMQDNPQIKIELSSHTDSRGSDSYNMKLSQKRAQSAVDYIVSKGISKDRITAKGYGESVPLNRCTNGVKCTEDEWQFNRRTEFKVTKIIQQ